MDLREFVCEYAGADTLNGEDLLNSGPASRRLLDRIGDEGRTRSLLATNFWRSWIASDIASSFMTVLGATRGVFSRSRAIVVSVDDITRFDMLVLDPQLPPTSRPKSIGANLRGAMTEIIMRGAVRTLADDEISELGIEGPQLAAEVSRDSNQPFAVVLAPEPMFQRLSAPMSPVPVTAATTSTAGALGEDCLQAGRFGVTGALHAIDPAAMVTVGTQTGAVVRTDSVTDSAFVELSPTPSFATRKVKGVMSGMTPRGSQRAEFVGVTSRACSTIITGWDVQIPNPSSRRQACIYTRRDAQPGDSGCALITDDDWIVGFAFERTAQGQGPDQCSWIWADSVLNRLKVNIA